MLFVLLALLCAGYAYGSPITVDEIVAPSGLTIDATGKSITIKNGQAILSLPSGRITDSIMSTKSTDVLYNKTFDKSSGLINKLQATYDFSLRGGTAADYDLGITIPAKAIVMKSWIDVITAPVSSGSCQIGISSAAGADILADTNHDALTTGVHTGKQTGTIATAKKYASASTVNVNVKTSAITAGKLILFLEYVLSE